MLLWCAVETAGNRKKPGISHLLQGHWSFRLEKSSFNLTPPPRGTVSSLHLHATGLLTKSADPHITEKCVTCELGVFDGSERTAVVFATSSSVRFWPVTAGAPVLSGMVLKCPLFIVSILTFISGRRQMTGNLQPAWRMAGWHGSTGWPASKLLLLKGRMGANFLPLLELLNRLIPQRSHSQLQRRGVEQHHVSLHGDGSRVRRQLIPISYRP